MFNMYSTSLKLLKNKLQIIHSFCFKPALFPLYIKLPLYFISTIFVIFLREHRDMNGDGNICGVAERT